MRILGIDSSCDDSCAALLDSVSGTLLSEITFTHTRAMKEFGGIVPELASREHVRFVPKAVEDALAKAQMRPSDIDWIAVTNRPGLIGSLIVGVAYAKSLAFALGKPFSTIDHIEAHLYAALLSGEKAPAFPWICLVVSGGHTELFEVRALGEHRWLGGTLDDAAGEAFDKIGKILGFEYPAGPEIDRLVRTQATDADRTHFDFPRAKVKGYDFSFSGLKTAVQLAARRADLSDAKVKLQFAASAQEAILDALVAQVQNAREATGIQNLVVSGGVACNSRLRENLPDAFFPEPRHCSDNAAMVAGLAGAYARAGKLQPADLSTSAIPRTDWMVS